jgi:hypothetical protein
MSNETPEALAASLAANKSTCDILTADTAFDLKTLVQAMLDKRYKQGFTMMVSRSALFYMPTEVNPFVMVLCCRLKAAASAGVFSYSLNPSDFTLGNLYNNEGFSQALPVGGTMYFFGVNFK